MGPVSNKKISDRTPSPAGTEPGPSFRAGLGECIFCLIDAVDMA